MTAKRVLGLAATSAGWFVLTLAVLEVVLLFYYRPTLEYASIEGRPASPPYWLTAESVGVSVGLVLAVIGCALLSAGGRWRRRPT